MSIVLNVRGIRDELARLNANLERRPHQAPEASTTSEPHEDLPLYVPGMHTPTGPLKIR